ncbi:MAG: SUF system Fe-S cluster assembly regulator [Gemmatimonadales bacterium]|nr:SUF system Fe-S cluster assembly regulator [Gemmatimonadales bacterium]
MVRVTKLTDYGIALMTCLAKRKPAQQLTAQDLSKAMRLPLPTVRKILKILAKAGLLDSTRGAAGGYSLARDPEEISLLDMISVLEGPVAMTECSSGEGCHCSLEKICGLKENWNWINKQLESTLREYNLAQMAGSLDR